MKSTDEVLDTKTISEILATLYDNRLQQILGYKDSRFTKELTDYLFVSFKELSREEYAGKYFAEDMQKYISNLLNFEKKWNEQDSNMLVIASYIETYTKSIVKKYVHDECPPDMEHYRKKITYHFTKIHENHTKEFPESISTNFIISQVRQAVARRNNLSHPKGRTHTTRYLGYLYLCGYDLLLGYLLYAFYHMVFSNVERKYYLSETPQSVLRYPSSYNIGRNYYSSTVDDPQLLQLQREWSDMLHIYADYLLKPAAFFIFGGPSINPKFKWEETYCQVCQELCKVGKELRELPDNVPEAVLRKIKLKKIEETLKERKNLIKNEWTKAWCNRLAEFFELRLCQSQTKLYEHLERKINYGMLLLSILKVDGYQDHPVDITRKFIEMLGDYLFHNTPDTPSSKKPLSCLVNARENYRNTCIGAEGYVDFENNRYTRMLMDLMEKLAELYPKRLKEHPMACHFLSLSEYLMALSVYTYITEVQIHKQNSNNSLPAWDFIAYIKEMEFTPIH